MKIGEGAVQCFWLEPTGTQKICLRRFTFTVAEGDEESPGHRNCPNNRNGCDATVELDEIIPVRYRTEDDSYQVKLGVPKRRQPSRKDRRWPKVCETCGQPFRRDDEWQINGADGYVRSDTGETVWVRNIMGREWAGALYDAFWNHNRIVRDSAGNERGYVGADGIALVAVCPNGGAWEVDGPSRSSGGVHGADWTRTGDPRKGTLQVQPSIICGNPGDDYTYHGWLGTNSARAPGWFSPHIG